MSMMATPATMATTSAAMRITTVVIAMIIPAIIIRSPAPIP